MTTKSSIEWTELTWNPTVGCTKISPGCRGCYAEVMSRRLKAMGIPEYRNEFQLTLLPERLRQPLLRKKPATYFVNSMSDLFHEDVPDSYIRSIIRVMFESPRHTYQVLTKRADRLLAYFLRNPAPSNGWFGVSVEDRKYGVPRLHLLKRARVVTKFLSIEPLLEDLGHIDLRGIDWVIVGGESGATARPMSPQWVKRILAQCKKAGIPFFFKQWGAWGPDGVRRSKHANGRMLQGKTWDQMPVRPARLSHG